MKVVLLLGAGATLADVATKPRKDRPPLDRRFFAEARLTDPALADAVARYLRETYAINLFAPEHDRLEPIMGLIYTDIFNQQLEAEALPVFRQLLQLFTRRLAATTNGIHPTNKRVVYRIVGHYLAAGVRPSDLTIITFNQDIQVEKMLHHMSTVRRWEPLADQIFAFPGLYRFADQKEVTSPTGAAQIFPRGGDPDNCISLLKLHGSLNWYSSHSTRTPSRDAMFKASRKLRITSRRRINTQMTQTGKQRRMYTLPIVVPPVTHKSAVLHESMAGLWQRAETCLTEADELVVVGYSCPALDFESSNQLRRSQVTREHPANISVVDPAPTVPERYISLLEAKCLHYYASAHAFLDALAR